MKYEILVQLQHYNTTFRPEHGATRCVANRPPLLALPYPKLEISRSCGLSPDVAKINVAPMALAPTNLAAKINVAPMALAPTNLADGFASEDDLFTFL